MGDSLRELMVLYAGANINNFNEPEGYISTSSVINIHQDL